MRLRISLRALPSLVRREYTSPMIRIVLAVTPASVLEMMHERTVKMVTVKKLVRDFICRPISGKELLFLKYGSYF